MKKIVTILLLVLSVYGVANAQDRQGGQRGERFKEMMKQRLKDSLQLSDTQSDSTIAILQEFQPKQRDIFRDQSLSREDKMAKLKDLRAQRAERLKTVLSDDQIKKYEEMEEHMMEQMRQRGGGRMNGGGS